MNDAVSNSHQFVDTNREPTVGLRLGRSFPSGRDLADLTKQLLGNLPTLGIVDFECLLGGLDQGPSDGADAEGRGQLAELSDLSGKGLGSHVSECT